MIDFSKYLYYFRNSEYRKILANIANFTFFQLTNYLVPLITIPYIVRIIGAGKFGIISFIQAVIYYFLIIVDYGFDISATQKVAQNRGSKSELNKIFSSVMLIKFSLMIVSICILLFAYLVFDKVQEYHIIYIFSFGLIPAQTMQAIWFFTGIEEMKYLNYTNLIAKLGYLAGILFFITEANDYFLIPAVSSASLLLSGIVSLFIIYTKFGIRFKWPVPEQLLTSLKDGWHVFISNFSINLYRNSNVFILGLVAGDNIVGYYSASEKIIKVIQSIFTPITRVLYPFISRKRIEAPSKSLKAIKILILFICVSTGFTFIIMILFAEPITITIFGEQFRQSINVIRICSVAILFGPVNYIIGIIFMLNYDMKIEFTKSVMIAGISNIILCYIFSFYFYEIGTAIIFVFTEFFLMCNYLVYIIRNRQKWSVTYAD